MQEFYLHQTFTLAQQAVKNGNHPFGALLVLDGEVVAEAQNTVISDNDVTRHAELNLISKFAHSFSEDQLGRIVLYASTEPCAMCTGPIVWSGIKKIVFGCSSAELNRIAQGQFTIECREIFKHSTETYDVTGPLLQKQAAEIHSGFW
jgi:tRNA(Arg) A34 adenosine deaminase TadA